ncbi:unnamed protein product [Cuscuta epithymum]|uniref:SBP-type domain-containing protein n=1 Tax=Cuscuta epithymum TaxID=186058 RepID=A0AAV0C0L0_9ASTE|nr:unnamed protein product [Cuscuta epithymum]
MDSWGYTSGGKGFACDKSVSEADGVGRRRRSQNGSMSWEFKAPCSIEGTIACSDQECLDEVGAQDFSAKPMGNDDAVSRDIGGTVLAASHDAFSRSGDASLIDLQLGGIGNQKRDANITNSQKVNHLTASSSALLSTPVKRMRGGGQQSCQSPLCQVLGCDKDLSNSKDYHKRHRVCEAHTKTSKVIVNGIEQRFCQQCSRFHLLAEFDDGKRSCRKRLAGHNERRRKPRAGLNPGGTAGRHFQSYSGACFQGTAFATSSIVCQDILPSSLPHPPKYETNEDWFTNVKAVDGINFSPQLVTIPLANGKSQPRPLFPSYNHPNKHCPSHSNSYPHHMDAPNLTSQNLFGSCSGGSEAFNTFNTSSTIQSLSGMSCSDRALSLLSPQSQTSSNHSSMVSTSHHHLISPGTNASPLYSNMARVSKNHLGASPPASTSGLSSTLNSPGINSSDEARLEQMLFSNRIDQQVSEYVDEKSQICGEDGGPTINLLQLSSRLQQVQHQRQENDVFFSRQRIT